MALCDRCKNKCKFMLKNKTLDTCSLFEKQTNFDRITKTPEALAEFLGSVLDCCADEFIACNHCPLDKTCIADKGFKQSALEWLKQESK